MDNIMIGQINLGTPAGDCLYKISSNPDVRVIVEIGTWNGAGSTRCIAEGMQDTDILYSLECNKDMYDRAKPLWASRENVKLIYGCIVAEHEMDTEQLSSEEQRWYQNDIIEMRKCPSVLESLPKAIDLLVLDGGEFSTFAEYQKLANRSSIIFLDDTVCRKNKKVRMDLLNYNEFELIEDHPRDRHGWSLFKRRSDSDK